MSTYEERAFGYAASRFIGKFSWKRRNMRNYVFLGDVIFIENNKTKGLEKAILVVSFGDDGKMYVKLTPHPRAPEIFMACSFQQLQ